MKARIFAEENKKWWTLAAVAFGLFMIMLDNTIVNVALPSIQRSLHMSISSLEWIVTAYALTFAALLITGGKLGDLYGRKKMFTAGLVVFTLASLACGLAPNAGFLIGARAVQGVGAALMNPATLSIITATFPPKERGQAIGIWAGVSALALAIGPLIGGLIVDNINWHWIFYVNVPVGLVGVIVSRWVITESRDTSHEQSIDLPGLATSGGALLALSYALIEGNQHGWGSPEIIGLFVGAAVLLAAFIALELRQRLPMLDLELFKIGSFAGANIVAMLVSLGMFGVFFFISLYVQNVLGYSPTKAGAIFLPMTILIILIAPIAGKLSDRVGSRWLMGAGMTILGVSLLLYQRIGLHTGFWSLLPQLVLGGVGMALTMSPMTSAAMGSVPTDKAGVGSGVLNSFRQVGGSLGIALMGAILLDLPAPDEVESRSRAAVRQRLARGAARECVHRVRRGRGCRLHGADEAGRRARAYRGDGSVTTAVRMPAAERRQALIDTAIRVFSEGSYRGTTTAEIARAAGISEPILYRHFASKRELYLAALDHVWGKMRASWENTLATTPDVRAAIEAMGRGHVTVRDCKFQLAELWVQALGEASEDPELRKHLRRHMREVHDFLATVIRRGQDEGVLHRDRNRGRRSVVVSRRRHARHGGPPRRPAR